MAASTDAKGGITMRYVCAPLEGVTGYLFRNAHHRYFPGVDAYYTPFVSPNHSRCFTRKEWQEILPAHNEGLCVVPQLLTRIADDFIWGAAELAAMGYPEINLNLGCPSGTVTAKGKGSGFLQYPQELDRFLEEVFSSVRVRVSVKTRLGYREAEEFPRLLEVFNRYPISQLIVHPRVRQDFYKGRPRRDDFAAALPHSVSPVCYNGDLTSAEDCAAFTGEFPAVEELMLGRGLVGNPALVRQCRGGEAADKATLRAYHDELYAGYCSAFGSEHSAMQRMKEFWFYFIGLFADHERHAKALRKTTQPREFTAHVDAIFQDLPLLETVTPVWFRW